MVTRMTEIRFGYGLNHNLVNIIEKYGNESADNFVLDFESIIPCYRYERYRQWHAVEQPTKGSIDENRRIIRYEGKIATGIIQALCDEIDDVIIARYVFFESERAHPGYQWYIFTPHERFVMVEKRWTELKEICELFGATEAELAETQEAVWRLHTNNIIKDLEI